MPCHMSRRLIASVLALVLFSLFLTAVLPQHEIAYSASGREVTQDEAALVQKDVKMHRRADAADHQNPLDGMLQMNPKEVLKANPQLVNAMKKLKPTAEEEKQNEADQAEFTDVINNRGFEYSKPIIDKMNKRQQEKQMEIMKPSIAAAKAFKDLQEGLWEDTRSLTRDRFEHTVGISMDSVDGVVQDMEDKQVKQAKDRADKEESARLQLNAENAAITKKKKAEAKAARKANLTKMQGGAVAKAPEPEPTKVQAAAIEQPAVLHEKSAVKKVAKKTVKKAPVEEEDDDKSGSAKMTALGLPLLLALYYSQ